MMTVVLAILLALAGVAVVLAAGALMIYPLRRPLRGAVERLWLRRCLGRRDRGDARLAVDDVAAALREFEAAFCFLTPRGAPDLLADITRLHTGLLGRFVAVGDDLPGAHVQLFTLAKVERLLDRWTASQRAFRRGRITAAERVELQRCRREAEHAIHELVTELIERRRPPLSH
jgi:hypothetical protein